MYIDVAEHYDKLIEENNDPFRDPVPLRKYMDKWDGQAFMDLLRLSGKEQVLEIGVGTGRLAAKTAPMCCKLYGIDISPETIERAEENLSSFQNVELICGDFLTHDFQEKFDVVYFSLVSMHFEDKQAFIGKISTLLKACGRLVFCIDKSQEKFLDMGSYKVELYPDNPTDMKCYAEAAGMKVEKVTETQLGIILACEN